MFYVGKRNDGQDGLFTTTEISRGDIFLDLLEGHRSTTRTRTSIQVDKDVHIEHIAAQYINHSSRPNCTVLDGALIATSDISKEEELVFDYTLNEDEIFHPFVDKSTNAVIGNIQEEKNGN